MSEDPSPKHAPLLGVFDPQFALHHPKIFPAFGMTSHQSLSAFVIVSNFVISDDSRSLECSICRMTQALPVVLVILGLSQNAL